MLKKFRIVLAAVAMLFMAALMPRPAAAVVLQAGYDFFHTDDASLVANFLPGTPTLHFSGYQGSLATALFPLPPVVANQIQTFHTEWVDMHGNRVSADSVHKVSNVQVPDPILINFDTVVRRPNDADLTGGGITPVEIEIVWLSLKSVAPIDIGGTLFDVYAGLADGVDQTAGRMNLLNAAGATSGQMDIGRVGVTTDDPSAPDFLGLPVNVDILFIPAGTPGPTRADAAQTVQNVPQVFHGCAQGSPDCTGNGPSGAFSIAEPSVLVLLAAFGLVGPAVVRLRARRAA